MAPGTGNLDAAAVATAEGTKGLVVPGDNLTAGRDDWNGGVTAAAEKAAAKGDDLPAPKPVAFVEDDVAAGRDGGG